MRARLLSTIAAATIAVAAALPATAADFNWRLSSIMPPDSSEGRGYDKFAELAKEYTKGRLEVRVYPSNQLGSEAAVLDQLQAGTIQIWGNSALYLQKWVPEMKFISAPFLFEDREHWKRFMDSPMVRGWMEEVEKKSGVTALGDQVSFPRGSYRVIVSKKPVNSLADLKGLKLRMHNDKLAVDAWTFLGTEIRVLGWGEIYEGLGRGIVEGLNSPAAQIEPNKFYEQAKYVTRHDEYPQAVSFLINARAYRALPQDVREALNRAFFDAAKFVEKIENDEVADSIKRMQARNGLIYSEAMDRKPFIERMTEYYKSLEAKGELPKGFMETVATTQKKS